MVSIKHDTIKMNMNSTTPHIKVSPPPKKKSFFF